MSRRKQRKRYDCIEYLSVLGPLDRIDQLENKQSGYIREYVKNKEYSIVATERRHGFSQGDVNRQWAAIAKLIRMKRVDGVVVANMKAVSKDITDAFYKIGQIVEAGGIVVTVDEGRLEMNIGGFNDGEEEENI